MSAQAAEQKNSAENATLSVVSVNSSENLKRQRSSICHNLNAANCLVTLTTSPLNVGQVIIKNTSAITAQNVAVSLPASLTTDGVTYSVINSSNSSSGNCNSLPSGATCTFNFTASATSTPVLAQNIPIKGTNTRSIYFDMQVVITANGSLTATPNTLTLDVNGSKGTVTVTNSSNFNISSIQANFSTGYFTVDSTSTCPTAELAPNATCTFIFDPVSPTASPVSVSITANSVSTPAMVSITVNPAGSPILSTTTSSLALSVNDTGTNAALTGHPRTITITNSGTSAATNVNYTPSPALPLGTTISPSSCGTIAGGGTCVLKITPGGTPSAAPGDTSATPITLTIQGTGTNSLTVDLYVLTYGSV